MRPTPWLMAEPHRIQANGYESRYGDTFGAFRIPCPKTGGLLLVLTSDGNGSRDDMGDEYAWDHASVSARNRPPNWTEMCLVKSIFWADDECVVQFHVPDAEHINLHPNVLHLWRPLLVPIPTPPRKMV